MIIVVSVMAIPGLKDNDARSLISYLLNGDSTNVEKLVNAYMESAYSICTKEKTKIVMESINSPRKV